MSAVTAVLWRCVRPLVHEHWCARPPHSCTAVKNYISAASSQKSTNSNKPPLKKPKTPQGRFDETEQSSKDPLERFPDDVNPITKEKGGPRGPEPTRYGDWERKGRCIDF